MEFARYSTAGLVNRAKPGRVGELKVDQCRASGFCSPEPQSDVRVGGCGRGITSAESATVAVAARLVVIKSGQHT